MDCVVLLVGWVWSVRAGLGIEEGFEERVAVRLLAFVGGCADVVL